LSATVVQRSIRDVDLSGDGNLNTTILERQTCAAQFSGVGKLALDGYIGVVVQALFSGEGTLDLLADTYQWAARDVDFSGEGELTGDWVWPIDGLSAVVWGRYLFQTAFASVGTLDATIKQIQTCLASFSGSGSLSAQFSPVGGIPANFSGGGSLTA